MVESVTGFLASDGRFFNNEVECRNYDAEIKLMRLHRNSLFSSQIDADVLIKILKLHIITITELLITERELLNRIPDASDQEPIEIES